MAQVSLGCIGREYWRTALDNVLIDKEKRISEMGGLEGH